MKHILFIILISCNNLFAQSSDSLFQQFQSNLVSFTVSPISLVDVYSGSSLKLGVIYKPIRKVAIGFDIGNYFDNFTSKITAFNEMKGFNFKSFISFCPIKNKPVSFGLLYKYKNQKFNYDDSIKKGDKVQVNVSRNVNALNFVAGYDVLISKRFYIEFQLGIGARQHFANNTFGSDLLMSTTWTDSQQQIYLRSRKDIMFDATFSMRLCFAAFKRNS